MKNSSLLLVLAGLILSACATKEADPVRIVEGDEVFYATIEEPTSRVYVDEGLRVLWNADDRVSIFNRYTYNLQYRFEGKDGDNSGTFTLVPDDAFVVGNALDKVYAVYPYREDTRITNDGEITVTLPAEQSYRADSFGPGVNTMISVTEDNYLLFKNLCGYLTVRLFGDNVSVSSISLRGNNAEPLAGQATVVARTDQAPSLTFDASATQELSIHFDTPVLLGDSVENATTFWLVVPPVTFSQGFTMTVTDDQGGQFVKSASSSITIGRNNLSKMAALRVGDSVPGEVTGISLDKTELTLIVGQSAVLLATVRPEDAADKTVTWTSSDASVATADGEGRVTAVAPGTATITADASGWTAKCTVTVTDHDEDAPIQFADEKLKEKLLIRFDTDKDGELSYREAAAVTTMEGAVTGVATIKAITSFDEFQYFTGVKTLPEEYFTGWESLSSITLPPSLTKLSKKAFYGCPALKSVVFSDGLERIGESAFANCSNLSSVVLPRTLIEIERAAFSSCQSLSSVILPDNLEQIGLFAFQGSGLTSIVIPGKVSTIEQDVFNGCKSLESVVLSAGVKTIGSRAFVVCESLVSIDFGTTVTEIGNEAFRECISLKNVVLPSGISRISDAVFKGCSGLVSVTLPDGISYISNGAFMGCKNLVSINIPEGVTRILQAAFNGCESLTSLYLPSSLTTIGDNAFSDCLSLSAMVIPSGVTSLGEYVFSRCPSLISLIVESGNPVYDSRDNCNAVVKTQTGELLYGCKGTVIPDSVTSIGQYAFYRNYGLESIVIPRNIASIGYKAFSYCTNLSSLTLSEGLESIGAAAFEACYGLTTVRIPKTVAALGSSAFLSCHDLTSVRIDAVVPPEAGRYMFDDTKNCPLYVPAESVDSYKSADGWKEYASRIKPIEP